LYSNGAGALSWQTLVPLNAKFIVQEANATLTAEQSLGALATGILKNTTTGSTGVLSIAVGTDLPAHVLNSAVHSVSGLTTGHFLKATGAATFGFAAHGLTASDVSAEPALGNPGVNDYVLSSKTDGTRSWIAAGGALAFSDLTDYPADDSGVLTNDGAGNLSWGAAGGSLAFADLTDYPADDEGVLTNDGAGNLSWAANAAGAPTDADYVVETANAGLSAESVLGTTVITTAVLASRQAAAKSGRLFLPTNSFYGQRDTGTAWESWGPFWKLTPPVSGDFSWVNQGAATSDSTYGGLSILAPAAAGQDIKILKKAAPATPYTITACFLINGFRANYNGAGLCFRQSADGKLVLLYVSPSEANTIKVAKWNSPTSYSAEYTGVPAQYDLHPVWLRITDNGTNRICSFSTDGYYWYQVHSVGRTDFLTADEVGFCADAVNATYPVRITLLSWVES
jgi:hypothetical protein